MRYRDLLRKYNEYKSDDKKFEYKYIYDKNLEKINLKYSIKSIAGVGNEFSQIKNVMTWVHDSIKHNGEVVIPSENLNIDGIIEGGREHGGTCFNLAIALSEAYLSLGFKSKYVRCRPMNYEDNHCHVVVQVYLKNLKKWIMMDPSFNSYVMDSNKNILNLQEIRDALIKGEELLVSDEINLNGQVFKKEKYIDYISKNIFRFETTQISGYNSENIRENKLVELDPLNYDGKDNNLKKISCAEKYIKENFIDDEELVEFYNNIKDRALNETIYTNDKEMFWNI